MSCWSLRYLGIPQRDHGRTPEGADCWGLVRLVYAGELGIDLPSYTDVCPDLAERAELGTLITGERDAGPWREVGEVQPFDVLLFRIGPHATHVAVAVDDRDMLHIHGHGESCIVPIRDPMWRKRLVGIYRYARSAPVHVVAARGLLPDQMRRSFDLAPTLTIAEIVDQVFPGAPESVLSRVRVTMARGRDWRPVPRAWWPRVTPHAGTHVALRLVPGDPFGIAINAALWLSSFGLATPVVNILAYGGALAVTALGVAALNSLIQLPQSPEGPGDPETDYAIQGWRNQAIPGEPVPMPMGRIRVAPVFAMQPYQQIVGDDQYVRALFLFGYGRLDISDIRIGDTPITEFSDIEYELREGAEGDDPVTITSIQVIEQPEQIELVHDYGRDAEGNPDKGAGLIETPVIRRLAANAVRGGIVLNFPGGLYRFDVNSEENKRHTVTFRLDQREVGAGSWTEVAELEYSAASAKPFRRQYTWALPSRGDWEIRLTRTSSSEDHSRISRTVYLAAVQGYRPEYPVNLDRMGAPLAMLSVKIRATHQLSGTLNDLNALVRRYAPDWGGETWSEALTRNPASAYLMALQGPDNPEPVADAEIDWEALAEWHSFCVDKGLHYDRDQRRWESLLDRLTAIAAAGRASPWHDGSRWSVIIDRQPPRERTHIAPHNSRNFQGQRSFLRTPDAVRVHFKDEDNDYLDGEIVVPWPGKSAPYDLVEEWQKPGKTNATEIAREIYRDMLVVEHRRDRWTVERDGAVRVETRGDHVWLTHPVLDSTQASARVLSVQDNLVILDEMVTMVAGQGYAIRFLDFDEEDPLGQSVLSAVQTVPGETRTLRVTGTEVPEAGAMILFGPASDVSERALVLDIEPGEDFWATVTLTNAAPEIDDLVDAYVPEDWSPIVGQVVDVGIDPLAPVFAGIATTAAEGVYGTDARSLQVTLATAPDDRALIASFELDHRLQGAGSWTTVATALSAGLDYDQGDVVELRARALDFDGDWGAYTAIATVTVGADLGALPEEIDLDAVSVSAGLGVTQITVAVGDVNTASVQIFRTATGDSFDPVADVLGAPETETEEDFLGQPLPSGQPVTFTDGDSTRTDLLAATYTAGGGWGSTSLPSTHGTGAASTLSQSVSLTAGETYRGQVTISGRTAGSVTLQLAGTTDVPTSAISDNGQALFSLDAVTGNDRIELVATSDFDGTVESLTLIRETAASAPQGVFDYRFAALNGDGIGSAVSDAITVTII